MGSLAKPRVAVGAVSALGVNLILGAAIRGGGGLRSRLPQGMRSRAALRSGGAARGREAIEG